MSNTQVVLFSLIASFQLVCRVPRNANSSTTS